MQAGLEFDLVTVPLWMIALACDLHELARGRVVVTLGVQYRRAFNDAQKVCGSPCRLIWCDGLACASEPHAQLSLYDTHDGLAANNIFRRKLAD